MTLTFFDIRIAQFGVETSTAAIDGKASGPFAGIGQVVGYEQLFRKALAGKDGLQVPWIATSPKASKFWKKYITGQLRDDEQDRWSGLARAALVPIRAGFALPTPHIHGGVRRSFGEALVWPLGIGVSWNSWIQAELSVDDVVALIAAVRHGALPVVATDGTIEVRKLGELYGSTLDLIRKAAWGTAEGSRSEIFTVISIADARWTGSPPADTGPVLATLLDGIGSTGDGRPAIVAGDKNAGTGETIYAAPRLRLVWLPTAFQDSGRLHRIGCLHRNLVQSSLQVEMLASATEMLRQACGGGPLPAAYVPFSEQVLALSEAFLANAGYSSPFLIQRLRRDTVEAARAVLQS